MKVSSVADDNIIDLKNFKKINGEIINVKRKRNKKGKKKKPVEKLDVEFMSDEENFDDEVIQLIEENQTLQLELFKERIRRQTIEKLLNKFLKQQQKNKENNDE
jgi:ACT domain-containing protein